MNSVVVRLFTPSASVSLSIKWAATFLVYLLGLLFESIVVIGVEALCNQVLYASRILWGLFLFIHLFIEQITVYMPGGESALKKRVVWGESRG